VRERHFFGIRLDHVLAQHRPEEFEKRADVARDRKIAPQRRMRLHQIDQTQDAEHAADTRKPAPDHPIPEHRERQRAQDKT